MSLVKLSANRWIRRLPVYVKMGDPLSILLTKFFSWTPLYFNWSICESTKRWIIIHWHPFLHTLYIHPHVALGIFLSLYLIITPLLSQNRPLSLFVSSLRNLPPTLHHHHNNYLPIAFFATYDTLTSFSCPPIITLPRVTMQPIV